MAGAIFISAAEGKSEQDNARTYSLKAGGIEMQVQPCSENIFRIRLSQNGKFTESLMERYGIVKTDWQPIKASTKSTGRKWTLTTNGYSISIDKKSGNMMVKDGEGNTVIRNISYYANDSRLCKELRDVVNKKYKNYVKPRDTIVIGDTAAVAAMPDKNEIKESDKTGIVNISMEDGERFYGGGGTSRQHIQHRGELLRMWSTYQKTEIPIPFMMSSRGWGIFDNLTSRSFFDVGSQSDSQFNILDVSQEADFYIFIGKDMPEILNEYTSLTGRNYVLPRWAYGLCFGPNIFEDQWNILRDAVMFRQFDVPCDVFWLEPQWMAKDYDFSTSKTWNYGMFTPDPSWERDREPKIIYYDLFIGKLRLMGIRLGLWLCHDYDLSLVEEDVIAAREGRDTSGQEHWMDHLTKFMDQGIVGFKLDPSRTIKDHPFREYWNGRSDKEMHNLTQVLLPKQMVKMGRAHNGLRTWHHYCGGWAGTQHWCASTSGDNGGGATALFDQLNLGMSGYMNTSCDVMAVSRDQEMQSLHFGIFLPWMQINSWYSMLQPFYYGKHDQDMYRFYIKLRYSLIPYIYSTALEGRQTGMPMVRSMPLSYPDDRNCDDMTSQFMYGQNLCVGVFSNKIYLPAGDWYDAWTGEKISSKGETMEREIPDDRAGLLFIKAGAIIPTMTNVPSSIGTEPIRELTLRIYPEGTSSFTMFDDDGETYEYENGAIASTLFECKDEDGKIAVTINPVKGSYKGMPESRDYALEVKTDNKPASVSLNGSRIDDWTYSDGIVKLSVGKVASDEKAEIILSAD